MKRILKKYLKELFKEFPVKEINIDMPEWIENLSSTLVKKDFFKLLKDMSKDIFKVRDINASLI